MIGDNLIRFLKERPRLIAIVIDALQATHQRNLEYGLELQKGPAPGGYRTIFKPISRKEVAHREVSYIV